MGAKFRKRDRGFELRSAASAGGSVRVIRRLCYDDAERMVRFKIARRLLDDDGEVVGYQLVARKRLAVSVAVRVVSSPVSVGSDPSSAVLSAAERDAVVGMYGESRTQELGDYAKEKRVEAGYREMDLVEAAEVKIQAFKPVRRRRREARA